MNLEFLEMEWAPKDADRAAAWELHIKLPTRLTKQHLVPGAGDERAALDGIHSLFGLTREALKTHGRGCQEFAKIAIVVLNQVVRPFTTKWHRLALEGGLDDPPRAAEFRVELSPVQQKLRGHTRMLGEMAGVEEDLSRLESR